MRLDLVMTIRCLLWRGSNTDDLRLRTCRRLYQAGVRKRSLRRSSRKRNNKKKRKRRRRIQN